MNPKNTHVAVLMGGWSAEREVSLNSGKACGDALEGEGFRVTLIDVGRDVGEKLAALKPDVVFNALHGPYGEDGCVQGILEVLGLPYTHSGVLASSLAMHKEKSKNVFAASGIPVADGMVVSRLDAAKAHVMAPPYVIKPVSEGSSVGVFIIREDMAQPPQQLYAEDWAFGEMVMVERYVAGREITSAVMGDRPLGVTEIITDRFYDYDAKYLPGGSRHICPAKLLPDVYQKIEMLALEAHRALGCRGVSRADFRYDDTPGGTGEVICLEVNTQPGMTATSLVPELAAHQGLSFGALVKWMVEDASCNR